METYHRYTEYFTYFITTIYRLPISKMECAARIQLPSFSTVMMIAMTALLPDGTAAALIDLGHSYRFRTTTCWDPTQRFDIYDVRTGPGPNGLYITESFSTPEHCGTHLDAPFHFNPTGWKLQDIPLYRMVVEGITELLNRTFIHNNMYEHRDKLSYPFWLS